MAMEKGYIEGKIDLDDIQTVDVTLIGEDKAKITKRLSLSEYIAILSDQADTWLEIPQFPYGTVKTKWQDKGNYITTVYVPKDVRPTIFMKKGSPLMIPYPNMVFYFTLKNGHLSASGCYAVKEDRLSLTDESKLYRYPFGNVYTGDGRICWGGNFVGDVKEPIQLERLISLFFDAATNSDLYQPGISCKKNISLEDLYLEVSGKEIFDEKLLSDSGRVFRDLYKGH